MKFKRQIKLTKSYSFFLFGARGTGKSSLLAEEFSGLGNERCLWIDLLSRETADRYGRHPDLLFSEIRNVPTLEWVVIDEVQRVPELLDVVHQILENKEFSPPKFALTGSIARKLKHGGANLLAGRAFIFDLFPFTAKELGEKFDLEFTLNYGSLPQVHHFKSQEDVDDFLRAYALTYLNEEVWAEHLVQKLDPFRRFLEVAAGANGQIVNYAKISRDTHADEKTVKRYFQILEETLLGFFIEPYGGSVRKSLIKSPKFYFFDMGVTRALARILRQKVVAGTYAYGAHFEHFLIAELKRQAQYEKLDFTFNYLKTKSGLEIDLVIRRPGLPLALVEIKSKATVSSADTKALQSLKPSFPDADCFCLSNDRMNREEGEVFYLHWPEGIDRLLGH